MTLKFALFLDSAKMFRRLAIVVLLFYCVHQASGREPQQCSRPNQLTKNVDKFACSKVLPDCCDNNTPEAHCCVIRRAGYRSSPLFNMGLTACAIFSVVFAAVLCAGCGGKKAEEPPPTPAAAEAGAASSQLQPGGDEVGPTASKKSQLDAQKSGTGSKMGKSKLDGPASNADNASAISALDSKSGTGSAIDSRTSNLASRISASATGSRISSTGSSLGSSTGSSLSSKSGSSALDSRSNTGSSLDSKASGTGSAIGSTVGGSALDSRSNAGSALGSRMETRLSSSVSSKSGFESKSEMGSNLDSKASGSATGSSITSKTSGSKLR